MYPFNSTNPKMRKLRRECEGKRGTVKVEDRGGREAYVEFVEENHSSAEDSQPTRNKESNK